MRRGVAVVVAALCVLSAAQVVPAAPARSGGLIALSIEEGDYSDLYVIRADGTGLRRLTKTPKVTEESPTWSSDGRRIAFSRHGQVGGAASVDVIGVDGSAPRRVVTVPSGWAFPTWSPDGHWIAFSEWLGDSGLFVVRPDGKGLRKLPGVGEALRPSWSPDSRSLVYAGDQGLRIIGLNGRGARRLTRSGYSPAWSPDGTQIVLSDGDPAKIWVVGADGLRARQLTRGKTHDTVPVWSSDGKQIAFVRSTSFGASGRLYVMSADGAHQRAVGPSGAGFPAWQP